MSGEVALAEFQGLFQLWDSAALSLSLPHPPRVHSLPSASGVLGSLWTFPDKANAKLFLCSLARLPSLRPTPLPDPAARSNVEKKGKKGKREREGADVSFKKLK